MTNKEKYVTIAFKSLAKDLDIINLSCWKKLMIRIFGCKLIAHNQDKEFYYEYTGYYYNDVYYITHTRQKPNHDCGTVSVY